MTKCIDEKIDLDVLRWFGHMEGMENNRIYVGELAGSRSVGRSLKR